MSIPIAGTAAAALAAASLAACDDARDATEAARKPVEGRTGPALPTVGCRQRAEGPPGGSTFDRTRDVVAGAVTFYGLRERARDAFVHPRAAFRSRGDRHSAIKVGAGVEAATVARVEIAPGSRSKAGLLYDVNHRGGPFVRLDETTAGVQFVACAEDEPRLRGDGTVGEETPYAGGFVITEPTCLRVRVNGELHRVPYGRACPV